MPTLTINTTEEEQIIDLTPQIQELIAEKNINKGLCNIFVKHATAAIIINENHDPNILIDLLTTLKRTIPDNNNYLHDAIDNNAAAHIKASILGPSVTIPIGNNCLQLGTWQSVMLVSFDGPRTRTVQITFV